MRIYILDDNMNPVLSEYAWEWIGKHEDKHRVAKTILSNGTWISTVFLTLDHSFSMDGDSLPVLWETMVFPKDSYEAEAMDRYCTYEQAVEGHKKMVEQTLQRIVSENPDANVTIVDEQ